MPENVVNYPPGAGYEYSETFSPRTKRKGALRAGNHLLTPFARPSQEKPVAGKIEPDRSPHCEQGLEILPLRAQRAEIRRAFLGEPKGGI